MADELVVPLRASNAGVGKLGGSSPPHIEARLRFMLYHMPVTFKSPSFKPAHEESKSDHEKPRVADHSPTALSNISIGLLKKRTRCRVWHGQNESKSKSKT